MSEAVLPGEVHTVTDRTEAILQTVMRELGSLQQQQRDMVEWRGRVEGKIETMQSATATHGADLGAMREALREMRGMVSETNRTLADAVRELRGDERRRSASAQAQLTAFLLEAVKIIAALAGAYFVGRGHL